MIAVVTGDDTSGVRIFPPATYLVAIVLGWLVQLLLPLRLAANNRVVERDVGYVLIVIALTLMFSAVAVFRLSGTTPNPTKPTTAFVVRGPYRFTRNPMYLALTLLTVGVGLAANVLWISILAFAAAVVTQRLVIAKEEPYLERKFGTEYLAYKGRVRRWV